MCPIGGHCLRSRLTSTRRYSFSFALNPHWTHKWAPQSEILRYISGCVDRFGLRPHIQLDTAVLAARWDASRSLWLVETRTGTGVPGRVEARALVSATGQLSLPHTLDVPGMRSFKGRQLHSAAWPETGVEPLRGKTVVCVGIGASAIQLIPTVAAVAKRLFVVQRTPNYIVPRHDYAYPEWVRTLLSKARWLLLLYRWAMYFAMDIRWPLFGAGTSANAFLTRQLHDEMTAQIKDPELMRKLVPSYAGGCKRILISSDVLPALQRPNVTVVCGAVTAANETSLEVTDADGVRQQLPADAVIMATGFEAQAFCRFPVVGEQGRDLNTCWGAAPKALLGTTVPGFPNFFVICEAKRSWRAALLLLRM
jgi:cation diffusion facilitator CzcD-associated flavoprotein CzcO